jgi:hypothetical protein
VVVQLRVYDNEVAIPITQGVPFPCPVRYSRCLGISDLSRLAPMFEGYTYLALHR